MSKKQKIKLVLCMLFAIVAAWFGSFDQYLLLGISATISALMWVWYMISIF